MSEQQSQNETGAAVKVDVPDITDVVTAVVGATQSGDASIAVAAEELPKEQQQTEQALPAAAGEEAVDELRVPPPSPAVGIENDNGISQAATDAASTVEAAAAADQLQLPTPAETETAEAVAPSSTAAVASSEEAVKTEAAAITSAAESAPVESATSASLGQSQDEPSLDPPNPSAVSPETPPDAIEMTSELAPQTPAAETTTPSRRMSSSSSSKKLKIKDYGPVISQIEPMDVLSGRGAAVNNHPGNKKFRALCFVRKAHFDVGNHAAKRKLATEIVEILQNGKHHPPSRFLKKRPTGATPAPTESPAASEPPTAGGVSTTETTATGSDKTDNPVEPAASTPSSSPQTLYYAMTKEQAILKAQQVMRDYKRPDRLEAKLLQHQARYNLQNQQNAGDETATMPPNIPKPHRARATPSTPLEGVVDILDAPDLENDTLFQANPFGVHAHDVLSGRGAYVNGHVGNSRLRKLAKERKSQFDAGTYTEKRQLAQEIVTIIKSLDPPGRFLKKASAKVLEAHAAKAASKEREEDKPKREEETTKGEDSKETDEAKNEDEKAVANDAVIKTKPTEATDTAEANKSEGAAEPATAAVSTIDPSGSKPAQEQQPQSSAQQEQQQQLPDIIDGVWEELSDDKAIHKACQVMRDISRPDRKYREFRKEERLKHKRNSKRRKLNNNDSIEVDGTSDHTASAIATAAATALASANETVAILNASVGEDATLEESIGEVAKMDVETSEAVQIQDQSQEPSDTVEEGTSTNTSNEGIPTTTEVAAVKDEAAAAVAVADVVDKALLDSTTGTTAVEPKSATEINSTEV